MFVHSYPPRLIQPFDGHLEIRDNRFVDDLTPSEAEAKFFPGMRFGLKGDFPSWLHDPDQVVTSPVSSLLYPGDSIVQEAVWADEPKNQPAATESQKSINYYNASPEAVEAWRQWKFGMHMQWDPSVLRGWEISWSR